MKFGIDYDGVIADTNRVKAQWIKKNLGLKIFPWMTDRTQCVSIIGSNNYERISQEVYGRNLSAEAHLVSGVRKAFFHLHQKGKIIIVTSRTTARVLYAQEWLKKHRLDQFVNGFYPFTREWSKETIAKKYQLDVLIDDDLRHLQNSTNKKLLKIWFKQGWKGPVEIRPDVHFAKDWGGVLKIITKHYRK